MQLAWTMAAFLAFLSTLPFFALPNVPLGALALVPATLYTLGAGRPLGRWPALGAVASLALVCLLGGLWRSPFSLVALLCLPSLGLAVHVALTGRWSERAKRWVPAGALVAIVTAFAEGAWLLHLGRNLRVPFFD